MGMADLIFISMLDTLLSLREAMEFIELLLLWVLRSLNYTRENIYLKYLYISNLKGIL
jgi:hypothetical protein